jgi:TrpR family transcriptional regulator, trp operon repressor
MKDESIEQGWNDFLSLCTKMRTVEQFNQLFALFLTFEERETSASRYQIVKALLEGELTQREIAETHQVSIAQITRGSNALKIVDPAFKKILKEKIGA